MNGLRFEAEKLWEERDYNNTYFVSAPTKRGFIQGYEDGYLRGYKDMAELNREAPDPKLFEIAYNNALEDICNYIRDHIQSIAYLPEPYWSITRPKYGHEFIEEVKEKFIKK